MPTYFIGILFDQRSQLSQQLIEIQKSLIKNELANRAKIVKPEKIHLTLKYIGTINDEALNNIKRDLSKLKVEKFEIQIDPTIKFFGGDKREPLLALDVVSSQSLQNLINNLEDITSQYFNDLKKRPFAGHISIVARDKKNKKINLNDFNKSLEKIIETKNFKFEITKVNLIKSDNGKYTIL